MSKIVTASEWQTACAQLLQDEQAAFAALDALNAKRMALPMVEIPNPSRFKFAGPDNTRVSLPELFAGRRQLLIYNFMLYDHSKRPCIWCAFNMDNIPQHLGYLHGRETSFVVTAASSHDRIQTLAEAHGWTFPFYGCRDTMEEAGALDEEMTWKTGKEFVGYSAFYRDGDRVFHTYSADERGTEPPMVTIALLDMTVLGRQEGGEDRPFPLRVPDALG